MREGLLRHTSTVNQCLLTVVSLLIKHRAAEDSKYVENQTDLLILHAERNYSRQLAMIEDHHLRRVVLAKC